MIVKALLSCPAHTNVFDRATSFRKHLEEKGLADFRLINRSDGRSVDLFRFVVFSVKNIKSDIVHLFEPLFPNSPVSVIVEKAFNRPVIVDTGDIHSCYAKLSGTSRLETALLKCTEGLAINSATRIIVRGRGHRDLLISSGVERDRIVWIPDGVDSSMFRPAKSEVRRTLDLEDKIVIGYVGTIKDIVIDDLVLGRAWELIQALNKLVEAGVRNVVVIIVGSGSGMPKLTSMVQTLNLQDKVIFTGRIDFHETPSYINAMDVCFLDSYKTIAHMAMMNTKLAQYMACGKPVVGGNIGEGAYLLKDCGMLVNPCILKRSHLEKYVCEIAEAMELLINDEGRRMELGRNARAKAINLFNWEKLSEQLYEVYSKALSHEK